MLKFYKRVLLGVRPPRYAFPEVVYLSQVLFPVRVYSRKHQHLLYLAHPFGSYRLLPQRIRLRGRLGHGIHHFLRAHPLQVIRFYVYHIAVHQVLRQPVRVSLGIPPHKKRLHTHGQALEEFAFKVLFRQYSVPPGVNYLALLIHNVIVFKKVFPYLEILPFHPFLGGAHGPCNKRVLYNLALFHAQAVHYHLDPVGAEYPHEVVFKRKVEPAASRVSLPSGPSAQLVVYTPGLMPFGAYYVQAAGIKDLLFFFLRLDSEFREIIPEGLLPFGGVVYFKLVQGILRQRLRVAPQKYVCAPPGHVGGYCHGAEPPGLGYYVGFPFVVFRVKHVMPHALGVKKAAQVLGLLNGYSPYQ